MPARIDGIALAAIGAGSLFAYAGIKDKSVQSIISGLIQGKSPATAASANAGLGSTGTPAGATAALGSDTGFVAAFSQYVGKVPYVGGAAKPSGWDCSGSCNYVICHDCGTDIPGYKGGTFTGASHGPSTLGWLAWAPGKLQRVSRASAQPNDLVIWQSHMGVVVDGTSYISAYDTQDGTALKPIRGGGPWGEVATFWRYPSASVAALQDVQARARGA